MAVVKGLLEVGILGKKTALFASMRSRIPKYAIANSQVCDHEFPSVRSRIPKCAIANPQV
ncbi:MAG: hypothetical protein F6K47_06135 [Symploca sp. SIO2E6]|nr:hypothetical protein [Symploca sp. SIO2E6]